MHRLELQMDSSQTAIPIQKLRMHVPIPQLQAGLGFRTLMELEHLIPDFQAMRAIGGWKERCKSFFVHSFGSHNER
jgi:hypothetical protein